MPDPRFFDTLPSMTAEALAAKVGASVVRGGGLVLEAVAPLGSAGPSDVAFLSDRKFRDALQTTGAGAVIVPEAAVDWAPPGASVLVSGEAHAAWARAALTLHVSKPLDLTSTPSDAAEDDTVHIGPGVVIGRGVRIGRGTTIGANSVIGPGVQIGRNCRIGPNVSIGFALLGDGVSLYAGARIGEAGFGAARSAQGPIDVPQLGRVIIQDRVTVGANTCIDRGAFDDTVIGEGTKIDNLVMIGHNCRIGRFCLIAAHTGLSGTVTVGDGVMFGGQAGVGDHITIGDRAGVAGGAGVLKDIPPGETWSGYPARPLRQFLRETAWLSKQVARRKGERDE